MFLGEFKVNPRRKNGRTFMLCMDGESNEMFYREKIPGYHDSGRTGSKYFEGEITERTIQRYIKEVRETLRDEI